MGLHLETTTKFSFTKYLLEFHVKNQRMANLSTIDGPPPGDNGKTFIGKIFTGVPRRDIKKWLIYPIFHGSPPGDNDKILINKIFTRVPRRDINEWLIYTTFYGPPPGDNDKTPFLQNIH